MTAAHLTRHLARAGLACRAAEESDFAAIDALRAEILVERTPGLPAEIIPMIEQQAAGRREAYRRQWPGGESVLTLNGEPVGHCWLAWGPSSIRLVDLGLLPRLRNRGLGTAFVAALCASADELGLPIDVSVRHFNPAERLYRRAGFLPVPAAEPEAVIALRRLPVRDNAPAAPGTIPPERTR